MSEPLVTIITPCYNGEKYLKYYFDSILSLNYSNLELIFVNDGSCDNTEEVVKSYECALKKRKIRFYYIFQENAGQARAMNNAFKYMHGKYLVWPDSDDFLTPDSIKIRVCFMEENPSYDMIRSNGMYFDFDSREVLYRISNSENLRNEDIFLDLILEKTYCACGCYMIRVSKFKDIYPDLQIFESRAGQNWQILIPMAGRSKCAYIDENQYYIAIRKNSHSRKEYTEEEQIKRFLQLKDILLNGILLSGRNDHDYKKIVESKYNHILMNYYLDKKDKKNAQLYFCRLKKENDLTDGDIRRYLILQNYFVYILYRVKFFVKHRILKSK
mgnify:CR=1 FL=1